MASLKSDHPSVVKVLTVLDQVGLNYSIIVGSSLILEGGVEPLKACRVRAFAQKVTDNEGMINCDIVQQGILKGRRALLAHVVDILAREHGVELIRKELHHALTVDEMYEISVDGTTINLTLMPR